MTKKKKRMDGRLNSRPDEKEAKTNSKLRRRMFSSSNRFTAIKKYNNGLVQVQENRAGVMKKNDQDFCYSCWMRPCVVTGEKNVLLLIHCVRCHSDSKQCIVGIIIYSELSLFIRKFVITTVSEKCNR